MSNTNDSRRNFLKFSGLSLLGAAALGKLTLTSAPAKAQAAKALPLVSESEPLAKTLGYYSDATKVDTKKWTKRAAADGKTQFCNNCILFNGAKPTTEAQGPCSLFPGKHVPAKAWCNSWAKNPAAKA